MPTDPVPEPVSRLKQVVQTTSIVVAVAAGIIAWRVAVIHFWPASAVVIALLALAFVIIRDRR